MFCIEFGDADRNGDYTGDLILYVGDLLSGDYSGDIGEPLPPI